MKDSGVERLLKKYPHAATENQVKEHIRSQLARDGWSVKVAMGSAHGIDVEAEKDGHRWIVEAKGFGTDQEVANSFRYVLGQALERMSDENAKYSIAVPEDPRYRNLWKGLPDLAKKRTGITCLFVKRDGDFEESFPRPT